MGNIEHRFEPTLAGINNLRGYRCAEQRAFLAHVDAVERAVAALASSTMALREALKFAQWALRLRMNGDDNLDLPYDEDLGEALNRINAVLGQEETP